MFVIQSRILELLEKIEHQAKAYIKSAKKQKQVNSDEEKAIKSDLKACLELGDEKVQLAVQTYELVGWKIVWNLLSRWTSILEDLTWT